MPLVFEPLPGVKYRYDYHKFFTQVAKGELPEEEKRKLYRYFIKNDLWFIVYAVMGIEAANHPFVVGQCRMVQEGPQTGTLDIWAREHFKSTLLTQAETLQYHLNNPEKCTGIFSYVRPVAKSFLRSIKTLCESSDLLKWCFPDVLWQNPSAEAPKWSDDEGIVFKRKGSARKESTIEAWGLTEGMPTGRHFDRRIYDDIETHDIADSPEMLDKVYSKFEMSDNLGVDGGIERVIGTYYSHFGPLKRLTDKLDAEGKPMYQVRLVPATDDGTAMGKPVLLSEARLAKLKLGMHFNSQQLCDPTPKSDMQLNPEFVKLVTREEVPENLVKFIIVDPAGDKGSNVKGNDAWAVHLFGVEQGQDELGQSNVYLLDSIVEPLDESVAVEMIVRLYMKSGIVRRLAYEKFGNFTPAVVTHVIDMLKKNGRRVGEEYRNFVWVRPAARNKKAKIKNALTWPLLNGKLHICDSVRKQVRDRIFQEMELFPFWHDDALDCWSYLYDLLEDRDIKFEVRTSTAAKKQKPISYSPIGRVI